MLMGGLFGRSVGALCHALGLTESLSGEEFLVQGSLYQTCVKIWITQQKVACRGSLQFAGVYAVVGSASSMHLLTREDIFDFRD